MVAGEKKRGKRSTVRTDVMELFGGLWTYWDEDGNITKTEMYKNGVLVQ